MTLVPALLASEGGKGRKREGIAHALMPLHGRQVAEPALPLFHFLVSSPACPSPGLGVLRCPGEVQLVRGRAMWHGSKLVSTACLCSGQEGWLVSDLMVCRSLSGFLCGSVCLWTTIAMGWRASRWVFFPASTVRHGRK